MPTNRTPLTLLDFGVNIALSHPSMRSILPSSAFELSSWDHLLYPSIAYIFGILDYVANIMAIVVNLGTKDYLIDKWYFAFAHTSYLPPSNSRALVQRMSQTVDNCISTINRYSFLGGTLCTWGFLLLWGLGWHMLYLGGSVVLSQGASFICFCGIGHHWRVATLR